MHMPPVWITGTSSAQVWAHYLSSRPPFGCFHYHVGDSIFRLGFLSDWLLPNHTVILGANMRFSSQELQKWDVLPELLAGGWETWKLRRPDLSAIKRHTNVVFLCSQVIDKALELMHTRDNGFKSTWSHTYTSRPLCPNTKTPSLRRTTSVVREWLFLTKEPTKHHTYLDWFSLRL